MGAFAVLAVTALIAAAGPTTITGGPVGDSGLASPAFSFAADNAAGFECSLDGVPFTACSSPDTVGPLKDGRHSFAVRAVDAAGTPEAPPATRTWRYVASPLASVSIKLRAPAKARSLRSALSRVAGTAVSSSRVTHVEVALQTGGSDKDYFPPRCHFFDLATGQPIFRTCVLPPSTRATGTSRWHLAVARKVRRRLPRGNYTVIVRAFNEFDQAVRRDFKLTLR